MLDLYIKKFFNLQTHKDRDKWSSLTAQQDPHKAFLLLSTMDLIAQGEIQGNFIELSFELADTFNRYWAKIMNTGTKGSMAFSFSDMKSEGFWHLVPNPGRASELDLDFCSMTRLREVCAGVRLDDELFTFMVNPDSRVKLRTILINHYFAPEIHPALLEQGTVNLAAHRYSKQLLTELGKTFGTGRESEDTKRNRKIRFQGFRKTILKLYDHHCALCGIRMVTRKGNTLVHAAHIRPWPLSHDDRPTNGLALCRVCHWAFDEGLMSISEDYKVMISERVRLDQNTPAHLLALVDQDISRPEKQIYWPSQDSIAWHRVNVYQS